MWIGLPLLVLFLWWAWRKKQTLINQFVQSRLLADLTVGVSKQRQFVRIALIVAAVACLVVALARPQGDLAWEEVKSRGLDVLIALDTSRSMLAEDLEPNRFESARRAIWDLAQLLEGDRIGLIPFAGNAFLQCPLTVDTSAFRHNLDSVEIGSIPAPGSNVAQAITSAAESFSKTQVNHQALVIFSDGEDHSGEALAAAREAAANGIHVFTVGVGSAEGELIPVQDDSGQTDYVRDDEGNPVQTRLEAELMKDLAEAGNGFYLPLQGTSAMEALYQKGLAGLPRRAMEARSIQRRQELYHWPLAIAIILLIIELFVPERRRVVATEPAGNTQDPAWQTLRTGVVIGLLLSFGTTTAEAFPSPDKARRYYEGGQYPEAQAEYQRLLAENPNDPRLQFNLGTTAYQNGDWATAQQHLQEALQAEDLDLQQQAYYNLGNALFQRGAAASDPSQRQTYWQQSLKGFKGALQLDPNDEDARHNYEFVRQQLEELQKQQQEGSESDQTDSGEESEQSQEGENAEGEGSSENETESEESSEESENETEPDPRDGEDSSETDEDQGRQNQPPEGEDERSEAESNDADPADEGDEGPRPASEGDPEESRQDQGEVSLPPDGKMTREQAEAFLQSLDEQQRPLLFSPTNQAPTTAEGTKDW